MGCPVFFFVSFKRRCECSLIVNDTPIAVSMPLWQHNYYVHLQHVLKHVIKHLFSVWVTTRSETCRRECMPTQGGDKRLKHAGKHAFSVQVVTGLEPRRCIYNPFDNDTPNNV